MREILKERLSWNRTLFFFVAAVFIALIGNFLDGILPSFTNESSIDFKTMSLRSSLSLRGATACLLFFAYLYYLRSRLLNKFKGYF